MGQLGHVFTNGTCLLEPSLRLILGQGEKVFSTVSPTFTISGTELKGITD